MISIIVRHGEKTVAMEVHPQELLGSVANRAAKQLVKRDKVWTVWTLKKPEAKSYEPNYQIASAVAVDSTLFDLYGVTV